MSLKSKAKIAALLVRIYCLRARVWCLNRDVKRLRGLPAKVPVRPPEWKGPI